MISAKLTSLDTKIRFLDALKGIPEASESNLDLEYLLNPILALEDISGFPVNAFDLRLVSDDLSGCMAGSIPILFMGSNFWQVKRSEPTEIAKQRAHKLASIISGRMKCFNDCRVVNVVIPEKDHYCASLIGARISYDSIEAGVSIFLETCSSQLQNGQCTTIYSLPKEHTAEHQRPVCNKMAYYDSHLPISYYYETAKLILSQLAIDFNPSLCAKILSTKLKYGDLGAKLYKESGKYKGEEIQCLATEKLDLNSICYTPNDLGSPLSSTRQTIDNKTSENDISILILGDSHSSVMDQSKLTAILALHVSKVNFIWNPYLVNGLLHESELERYKPDLIVNEISERFIFNLR